MARSYHSGDSGSDDDSEFHSHFHASSASTSSASPSPSPPPSPPPIQHNYFAPPFYNRPPTPLPPSPSLTSLLRPSRPTTPDASDAEDLSDPLPRASPKVPTYEYYGFVLYLFSSLAFGMYILWSFLPSPFLHALGIYYYPNRWWSLAIPSWIVILLVYIYVALAAYNIGYLTLPMNSIETIIDDAANVATIDGKGTMGKSWAKDNGGGSKKEHRRTGSGAGVREGRRREREERRQEKKRQREGGVRDWKKIWSTGTDACLDVPLGGVCEVLYGEGKDIDPEDEYEDNAGLYCG